MKTATNAIFVGPSGLGKTTIAQNIAHQAVLQGHTVLFTTAGQLLGDLTSLDSESALRRRIRHYVTPTLLVIDEVGYLSYSTRHADLLFELINRRHEQKSTVGSKTQGKTQEHRMKQYPQPSGLQFSLDFLINSEWTPEQAYAVFQLLDDLRERILAKNQEVITEKMREECGTDMEPCQ